MPRVADAIPALNSGEWDPKGHGRIDLAGRKSGARVQENLLTSRIGALIKRGGTRYVAELKDSSERSWLVRFVRRRKTAYIIEFGDQYCRFYFNRAQVDSGGSPYEITSPYALADLVNDEGEFNLDIIQSADVLYIVHRERGYSARKLSRTSSTSWAFSELSLTDGPWQDTNDDDGVSLYASAASGSVTITAASGTPFNANMVNQLIRLDQEDLTATDAWKTSTSYTSGDYVRSEGHEYKAATTASSGTTTPAHTSGTVSDGAVDWEYITSGSGWARITAYTDAQNVTATVIQAFPQTVVGSGNATTLWRHGAFGEDAGHPQAVTLYRRRLALAKENVVHLSQVADFESFAPDEAGEVLDTSGISVRVDTEHSDDIVGLSAGDDLVIHMDGAEAVLTRSTTTEPLSPSNVDTIERTAHGSRPVRPVKVEGSILFLTGTGRQIRELRYDLESDGLIAPDATLRSSHITGERVTRLAYQPEPHQAIYAPRLDGQLVTYVHDRAQQVSSLSRIIAGGSFDGGLAVIEDAQVIPSPDGLRYDVWLIVKRTINGATKRYVEYISEELDENDDQEDAFYVDSGLVYSGSATQTVSGLDHLEGETVNILADGAVHPARTVSSGSVSLDYSASKIVVGLGYLAAWEPIGIEAGASNGAAAGRPQKVAHVDFLFHRTLGGRAGFPGGTRDAQSSILDDIPELNFRSPSTAMGAPSPLYSGYARLSWPKSTETQGARIRFEHDDPLPCTLAAVFPTVRAGD